MASWVLPGDAEDREILRAARRSDQMDLLYRRYAVALRAFCRKRLNGDEAAAEDACHETVLKAYRALPGFRPGARMWPWLSTIAARVCIDIQRDRARMHVSSELPITDTAAGPEDIADQRARSRLFRDAMRRMGTRHRTYVYLKDVEGWSYDDIAVADHTTVPAVRTALHRGRRQLKDHVAALAHERHEWPLPAFMPVLWWRVRGRVAQVRDWAATWATRLDPTSAVNAVLGSTAVQASFAVVLLAGAGSLALSPDAAPIVVDSGASSSTAFDRDGVSTDASAAPAAGSDRAGADPGTAARTEPPRLVVNADAGVRHRQEDGRDVYQFVQADGTVDANGQGKSEPIPLTGALSAGWTCDEEQPGPASATVCPMLDKVGE